jgi:hypothetical protein
MQQASNLTNAGHARPLRQPGECNYIKNQLLRLISCYKFIRQRKAMNTDRGYRAC